MEAFVCLGVAALSGAAVWGVTGCVDGSARVASPRRTPREAAAEAGTVLLALVGSLGAFLTEAGIPPEEPRARLAGELRRVEVGGRAPFKGMDEVVLTGSLALISAAASVVVGVLAWSPVGALIGAAAPAVALLLMASKRSRAEKDKVAEAMPEAFGALSISLGSGLSLTQAMRYVGSHSEEPVRDEFMRAAFAMGCGVPAAQALDEMVERLEAPGLELVSLALKISKRTGAPLKDLLSEASALAGERIELARRLDVKTSQARMSAQLVAAMPVAMVVLLSLISEDFRAGVSTTTGALCVAVALGLDALAWLIIRKIMQVEM